MDELWTDLNNLYVVWRVFAQKVAFLGVAVIAPALTFLVALVFKSQLECGPMPNVMVALPNIGGALCSTPQSLADAHY